MSYTPPAGNAVDFQDAAGTYTPPAYNAVDFQDESDAPADVVVNGAAVLGAVTAASAVSHGIAVDGVAALGPVTAAGEIEFTSPEVVIVGAALLGPVVADGAVAHGVSVVGAAVIGPVIAAGDAAHGVAAVGAATLGPVTALGGMAHGISVAGVATLGPVVAAGDVLHPRYVLKGEVRDAGVLVNRTVRAYRRSDGALIGEQLTDLGRFDIHAGFTASEHYLLPIDLDSGATDFTPPAANRVLSVLAED